MWRLDPARLEQKGSEMNILNVLTRVSVKSGHVGHTSSHSNWGLIRGCSRETLADRDEPRRSRM